MFANGLRLKTKQLIDTTTGSSSNFSTATSIKKIIEAIAENEHLELYDRCSSKSKRVIDLKLETNKIRIEDTVAAEVEKKLKAMNIGRRIPIKQKDHGSVTVPCTIKDRTFKKVLLSIYQRLGIGNVSDTRKNLKFANHSIKNAYGIAEDVLVTIEQFYFPVDFVIIDIPEDEETPIIPGRPFMRTSQCNFDIGHGTLTLKVYDDEITLNVLENKKLEVGKEYHYQVGMIRTDVKGQSDMPTSEKVSRRSSHMVSPPLATPSGKTPISIPKAIRKKR
ncbi:uncharacterized protein LOC127130947 [Lathyrus oleraceus]|uniref:uncharacterized protein LOC127130947 n=1 Tax=Pisum sativum TaxID=3888 RepID=UPI0021D2ECC5|nr:uncharacterized protein LOC127130947 [Pisum sativum]